MRNDIQETLECVVIGAGVVGLAVASALAKSGKDVLVLESEDRIGTGISSRNSEVIHAGIYYPKNSLKAKLCVHGKHLLYQYVSERGIDHIKCGKLIVATRDDHQSILKDIQQKATENGVNDLQFLSRDEVKELEPDLTCQFALLSPSTGIIDTHDVMTSLQGDLENYGGSCVFLTSVSGGKVHEDGTALNVKCQGEEMRMKARIVINATGLDAVNIARNIKSFPVGYVPQLRYAKGNYFSLSARHSFKHLIYPVPEHAGLGIHLTLDLQGKARFGPDVEWVDQPDYRVEPKRSEEFYDKIRQYWPDLPDNSLTPDYAGIRPKIYINNKPYTDFIIQGPKDHGIPGFVNLFGVESPGLTSSLAIAEHVLNMID